MDFNEEYKNMNKVERILSKFYPIFEKSEDKPFSGVDVIQVLKDNPGLLELPDGKNFWDMDINHYVDLVKRKGRVKIEGALLALRILNANDDPDISKKAEDIRLDLKQKFDW